MSAFNQANGLNWNPNAKKIVVFLTDSAGHGIGFHDYFNEDIYTEEEIEELDEQETPKLIVSLENLTKKGVELLLIGTNHYTRTGLDKIISEYNRLAGFGKANKFIVNCQIGINEDSHEFALIRKDISSYISLKVQEKLAL